MILLIAILKMYMYATVLTGMLIATGLVQYGGVKYANVGWLGFCLLMGLLSWPFFLIKNPIMLSRMLECTYYEAIQMQTSYLVMFIDETISKFKE